MKSEQADIDTGKCDIFCIDWHHAVNSMLTNEIELSNMETNQIELSNINQ